MPTDDTKAAVPCPRCQTAIAPDHDACTACGATRRVCGRFDIRSLLGRGGMGLVYEAREASSGERVAVKTLSLGSATDWRTRELFERSTHVLMGLSHAALPKVHAFDQDDAGRFVLVRDVFDGGTLEERIGRDDRRLSPEDVRTLLERLLDLLVYLQARVPPIIHRDIKPSNVMFRGAADDAPVLVDFDTVMAPESQRSGLTVVGTPGYTAPEQFAGDASPSSDLYSLGATMLFVVTHTDADRLPRLDGRFDVGSSLAALDPDTRRVLSRMVETERSKRYATAAEALADLRRPAVAVAAPPLPPAAPRASAPSPVALVAAAAGVVVLVVGVGVWTVARRRSSVPAPPPPIPTVPAMPIVPSPPLPTAAATTPTPKPSASAPEVPANIEPGPVTLTWKARLTSSTGAAPRAGTACVLSATVSSRGRASAREDLLTLTCQGATLYDSSVPLNGMSNSSFGLVEVPTSGKPDVFRYQVHADDIGSRSGSRAQITLDTSQAAVEAFRETVPSYRVKATVDTYSGERSGRPLTVLSFNSVERKATVTTKIGKAPFSATSCELAVQPVSGGVLNCRVRFTCGGISVYGKPTGGYGKCTTRDGEATGFLDEKPTPVDGDPALSCDLDAATAILSDTKSDGSTYEVDFALSAK